MTVPHNRLLPTRPGLRRINPLLIRTAEHDEQISLLGVLREATKSGLKMDIGGRRGALELPPSPQGPFSVLWFDDNLTKWGRIGFAVMGEPTEADGERQRQVLVEEGWNRVEVILEPELIDRPERHNMVSRWSMESGWEHDWVIFLSEPQSHFFLMNWCRKGYPVERLEAVLSRCYHQEKLGE